MILAKGLIQKPGFFESKKPGFYGNVGMEPKMGKKKPGFSFPTRDRHLSNQQRNRLFMLFVICYLLFVIKLGF